MYYYWNVDREKTLKFEKRYYKNIRSNRSIYLSCHRTKNTIYYCQSQCQGTWV